MKNPVSSKRATPVEVDQLSWECDAASLPFDTTAELEPNREIIGQDRAIRAITLGLAMKSPGYNIFLTGFVGSGRNTTIRHVLRKLDETTTPPPDLAYVHNFEDSDRPRSIFIKAGRGNTLRKRMKEIVRHLEREIPKVYDGTTYRSRRGRIEDRFRKLQTEQITVFESELGENDFALIQVQEGPTLNPQVVPVWEGEPHVLGDLEEAVEDGKMKQDEFEGIRDRAREYTRRLQDVVRDTLKVEAKLQTELSEHDHSSVRPVVHSCLELTLEEFHENPDVVAWLQQVEEHVVENVSAFQAADDSDSDPHVYYEVNLVVDNADRKGAPVVIENTPGMGSLFGMVDRRVTPDGQDTSDHTRIKTGCLQAANGGYLVLNASDIFSESATVWNTLKRVLRTGRVEIPAPEGLLGPPALKPMPVCVDVKVILVGDHTLYTNLHAYDEDFRKIFKVRADFDTEMENTPENLVTYGEFIQRLVDEEPSLRPFDRTAVARIAEYGVRLAGRRNRLSTRFNQLADLVREANYFADQAERDAVTAPDVDQALEEKDYRNNLAMEKMQELIHEGSVFINVTGTGVGEVNGLAVYESGEHAFGLPAKITASVSLGNSGIINIEREAELSGRTHDKGVQILAGFLRERFAQDKPLTLSASICFEQSYHGVDGDSASSTELYAILSALSDLPLRQDIAVTGSVNQKGEIQPIGGVNEKIEGFFDICSLRGLTGTQGVLIPATNVDDLMLHSRVIDAVRDGKFQIHTASTIDEGMELLTGVDAGRKTGKRRFPSESMNGKADAKLRKMATLMRDFGPS